MTRLFARVLAVATCLASLYVASVPAAAADSTPSPEEAKKILMSNQPLPDTWLGDRSARVTVIEYASLGCGHCAEFYVDAFPDLKRKYIDTGKIRFAMRDFVLQGWEAYAVMLARCSPKRDELLGEYLKRQSEWMKAPSKEPLVNIAAGSGMSREAIDRCIADDTKALALLSKVTNDASSKLGFFQVPIFFVDGVKSKAEDLVATIEKALSASR